jgi:hypothetical protein
MKKAFIRGARVFALCFLSLCFFSCPMEGTVDGGGGSGTGNNTAPSLQGQWVGVVLPSNTPDTYTVTAAALEYDDHTGDPFEYSGAIAEIVSFSASAGVIIIQYTAVPPSQGNVGNFFGVYYRDLSSSSVRMANAWAASGGSYPQATTLQDAKNMFKEANVGAHVSVWGRYNKQ